VPDTPDPIDLAARALRHRDRSRVQIDERLTRAGVGQGRRAEALETLERLGYVDDGRFADARAAALAGRGYGDEAIRELLAADGIAEAVVETAVAALEPEAARAARIVERGGRSLRTARQLGRKGFGEDAIAAAVGEGIADAESEA
jgi:SOS response regulatory protein OraA/RecX